MILTFLFSIFWNHKKMSILLVNFFLTITPRKFCLTISNIDFQSLSYELIHLEISHGTGLRKYSLQET